MSNDNIHFTHAAQQIPQGDKPIMVEENHDCKECGKVHDIEKCPKCGSCIDVGYGLVGGGMGSYKACMNEECDWFYKECECAWCEEKIEHGTDTDHPGICVNCHTERTAKGLT